MVRKNMLLAVAAPRCSQRTLVCTAMSAEGTAMPRSDAPTAHPCSQASSRQSVVGDIPKMLGCRRTQAAGSVNDASVGSGTS